ncbi:uncharacterized protein LOC110975964 [Acanthaster planci]|uniref:Uncharacterized protein LOC110975964 n=1 Tax=Acanthaster planci TaxID=133434 RepID=A0A8B7XUL5_ACAPL|nr:uncharacterized protein LOC110975964 [Acanthaster planci]
MKLFAFVCVTLACVAAEANEDRAPTVGSFDFGNEWDDQTVEGWDEEHKQAWKTGNSLLVPNAALRSQAFSCSCESGECQCCLEFTLVGKTFRACLVAYFNDDGIGIAVVINSFTIFRHSFSETKNELTYCGTLLGREVCAGLTDISLETNSVSARGTVRIGEIVNAQSEPFTLPFSDSFNGVQGGGHAPAHVAFLGFFCAFLFF